MTSPYNYTYPSPSIPSPLSSLLPSITQQTSGLGLTPGSNPFLAFQPNSTSNSNSLLPPQSQGGGSVRSTGGSRREEINLDDCLRGLEEGGRLVERAKGVIGDIERIRGGVFGRFNGPGEGAGVGEEGRLELLQLEYDQIIKTIYELSLSTLFGSLPLTSISSNTNSNPQSNPNSNAHANANVTVDPISTETTTQDLTTWLETRAALEFSRRESVKASSKIVLDILKSRS